MPKITIIMPALNVAKYVEACVESVLDQTLQDIEILIIDAGSDDGTLEILDKYAALDERIEIVHSNKKSYGYQLNLGISMAKGEYVGIVETDDMIVPDMYESLYNKALAGNVDYVKGRAGYFVELKSGAQWEYPIAGPFEDAEMFDKEIAPCTMPELLTRDIYLWTGIYKKEFIKNILFNETPGAAFQDQGFLFQTISSAKKAVYLDKIVYKYRQDNNNSSIFNRKGFYYLVEEYAYIEKFLVNKDKDWINVYYQRMFSQCIGRFRTMAFYGSVWEEATADMKILQKRLRKAVESKALKLKDTDIQKREMLELFLSGTENIYSYCVEEYRKKIDTFESVIKVAGNRQIIIFGAGRIGRFLHVLIDNKCPDQTVAYCDNNSAFWHTTIQGMLVMSPEDAVQKYTDAVFVIANFRNADAIDAQLQALGIENESICLYQEMPDILLLHINDERFIR